MKDIANDEYIEAYAYPEECKGKSEEEKVKEKLLAGKLLVCKNDHTVRDSAKFVFVRVKTNITGAVKQIGTFNDGERDFLRNILYQVLVRPLIWVGEKDANRRYQDITLNLEDDDNFKRGGLYIKNDNTIDFRNEKRNTIHMMNYIKQKFIQDKPQYEKYFTIFAFEARYSGRVEDFGVKNVVVADNRSKTTTIAHEALHGFGLRHTHREKNPIDDERQKYIFPHG